MKTEVLSLIRNADTYVSGQELCEKLGVSRTAVWKVMKHLQEEGYVIEAVQNKGYRLISSPDVMTESEIAGRLQTKWAGQKICYLKETASTNTAAKHFVEEGAPHGTLVVAKRQYEGRGRRGRTWAETDDTSIAMTLLLRPSFAPDKASMLTLVMALAVVKAIEACAELPCYIKWPNDIVINGKKICGILTEMNTEADYIHYVIIGVGINVNTPALPQALSEHATSLFLETGQTLQRAEITEKVLAYFEKFYELFLETEDLSALLEPYHIHLINKDREVKVLDPLGAYIGIAKGINEKGELKVQKETGETVTVCAGEVSVRGVFGYV